MKSLFVTWSVFCLLVLLSGCATTQPNSEFVKTVNFSALDSFSFRHTLVSGSNFRYSEEHFLEELSEQTMTSEMLTRGFEQADDDGDFFVVVKWSKFASNLPGPFDHIDGASHYSRRRDSPSHGFNARFHLTVEIYETSSGNLFWRNELPNIFDAIQLTEQRVVDSLKRAIEKFPSRVAKDPNLPNIR